MAWVTIRDGAAHLGVPRMSLHRKVKDGSIPSGTNERGHLVVELEGLRDRWTQVSRLSARAPAWQGSHRPAASTPAPAPAEPAAAAQTPAYNDSRARCEHEKANILEMERRQLEGELGSIADMKNEAYNLARATREAVLSVPPRICAELAATGDDFACEQLLERELITALRSLGDQVPAPADDAEPIWGVIAAAANDWLAGEDQTLQITPREAEVLFEALHTIVPVEYPEHHYLQPKE